MSRLLPLLLVLLGGVAWADEKISICYNYGCAAEAVANYSEARLATLKKVLLAARSAEEERLALSAVVGQLYYWAGQQTPVYADRGGNMADDAVNGAMDCIDHSTTTTRFLNMLHRRGWLPRHRVLEPVRRARFFLFQHFSAVVEELPHRWLPREADDNDLLDSPWDEVRTHQYAVDSWFVNNGKPAVILPLDDWMDGAGPDVEPD